MARIRTIKQGFFQDEDMSTVDAETQILAAGLLCYADDEGYFNANEKLIGAFVFPLRELSRTIPEMLQSLQTIGYLRLGTTPEKKTYGHIRNFLKHQRVSHPTPSTIKDLEIIWSDSRKFARDSGTFPNDSALKGIELNGRELNRREAEPAPEQTPPDLHEMNYATRLIEDLGMVNTRSLILVVAAAVVTASRGKRNKGEGFEWLRKRALDAKTRGDTVNRFWFEDSEKWEVKADGDGSDRVLDSVRRARTH